MRPSVKQKKNCMLIEHLRDTTQLIRTDSHIKYFSFLLNNHIIVLNIILNFEIIDTTTDSLVKYFSFLLILK